MFNWTKNKIVSELLARSAHLHTKRWQLIWALDLFAIQYPVATPYHVLLIFRACFCSKCQLPGNMLAYIFILSVCVSLGKNYWNTKMEKICQVCTKLWCGQKQKNIIIKLVCVNFLYYFLHTFIKQLAILTLSLAWSSCSTLVLL